MIKAKWRQHIFEKMQSLSPEERNEIEQRLHKNLYNHTIWKNAQTIGVTFSNEFEWDTSPLIEKAWKANKNIALPKTNPASKRLDFYIIRDFSQLKSGYAGIWEPDILQCKLLDKSDIDLIIVPGVVFNKAGYRIGFGGGYYDRFLASFQGETAALVSTLQFISNLPVEAHDVPVHTLITDD
ncbi:MAG TPA: 5-formyltetrahydrofolate cyclo-ligase [Pseudogracilibacillus sp.]|nr:5-formyltetrahydrofolate cyclo-ligase [Pseudogracilibacillus sp.]